MNYFIAHIGEPNNDAWWSRLLGMNIVAAGADNVPNDRAAKLLDRIEDGDVVVAHSPGNGFIGVGIALGRETYHLAAKSELPPGYESPDRHQRGVQWTNWTTSVSNAIPPRVYET